MPTTDELKQRIEAAIPGASAEVEDLTGGGDHFRATVVVARVRRAEPHRAAPPASTTSSAREIGGPIHALSLKTQTPE